MGVLWGLPTTRNFTHPTPQLIADITPIIRGLNCANLSNHGRSGRPRQQWIKTPPPCRMGGGARLEGANSLSSWSVLYAVWRLGELLAAIWTKGHNPLHPPHPAPSPPLQHLHHAHIISGEMFRHNYHTLTAVQQVQGVLPSPTAGVSHGTLQI